MTDDLRSALALLTADLDPDPALVERGLRRGRRLRTRRRVTAAATALGSVAVVAAGFGLVNDGLPRSPFASGSGADDKPRFAYSATTYPKFQALAKRERARRGPDRTCFSLTGQTALQDRPSGWSCWQPDADAHSTPSLRLAKGWAVAIDAVRAENVGYLLFVAPNGRAQFVPAVAVGDLAPAGWRFGIASFDGTADQRGTFIPVVQTTCTAQARGARGYDQPLGKPMGGTPEAALAAALGAAEEGGPLLPPKDGYSRVYESTSKVTFGHHGKFEVDVVKVSDGAWATAWMARCT